MQIQSVSKLMQSVVVCNVNLLQSDNYVINSLKTFGKLKNSIYICR